MDVNQAPESCNTILFVQFSAGSELSVLCFAKSQMNCYRLNSPLAFGEDNSGKGITRLNMNLAINVLLIEDNPEDTRLVQEELHSASSPSCIHLEWVDCLQKGLDYLKAHTVHAVLVDLSLPDSDGLSTLQRVMSCASQLPVIVLTDFVDEETGVQALQAGAQDFLIKGQVDGKFLVRVIQYGIQRKQIEMQLADALEFTRCIVTASPVGIFTYKLSGECLSVNAAAAHMVGGTIEQLINQNFHQIESWKKSGLYTLAMQAINTGEPVVGDVHVSTSFGRDAWYTAQFVTFRSGGDELLLMMFSDITERKMSEKTLRERESLLDQTQSISHVGSWELDLLNNHLTWSDEVHRIFGVGIPEFKGTYDAFLNVIHPDDRALVEETFSESVRKGLYSLEIEYRIIHQLTGEIRFIHQKANHKRDDSGKLIHSVGMVQDITERKQVEAQVNAIQRRFQSLIENAPDGIALLGIDGKLRQVTPSTQKILGYTLEEASGQDPAILTHPDDLPTVLMLLNDLIQNPEKVIRTQYRFQHKDGSWRWLESIITNLLAEPSVQSIVFNYRDITDQKQTEEKLLESEDRYRDIVEHIRDLIGTHDLQGNILSINPAATDLLGFDMDSLFQMNMRDLLVPEVRSGFDEYLATIQRDGHARGLMLLQTPGGQRRIWEYDNTLRIDAPNGPVVRALARDVTGRKQAEKALKEKERLLSEAQRIGHIGSWSYDIDGDTMKFSDEMYRLLDVQPEEFHHNLEEFLALVYPSDRPIAVMWFAEIKEATQAKELDFRIFHKNGELRYLRCTGAVEFDPTSKPARFIGTAQDVTERRTAEIQINQQVKRLTTLSEIDRAIISSFDQSYTLNVILSHIISQLQVDAVDILLLDSEKNALTYAASQGFRTKLAENTLVHVGESHAGRAIKERRMIRIPDLREAVNSQEFDAVVVAEGFVSYIAMPLIAKGNVKGVLEIYQRSMLQPYQDWLEFFHTLVGQTAIAIDNTTLFENLHATNKELIQAYEATIEGWSRAMDLRDRETEGHTQRVTKLTLNLARSMGIEETRLIHIRRGALLHDIGKLGVPDHILFKADSLTREEREIIEQHVDYAYEMLAPIPYLKPALNIPYFHHEKWDGTGYPLGLKGEQIPLEARIFALVDVWDALLSDRPYRQAWTREQTTEYIRAQSGAHFDPQVVECFFKFLNS